MASGGERPPSGGFGRGGRGAALLQALNKLPRKPGAPEPEVCQASSLPSVGQAATSDSEPPQSAPVGRGSFLASLRQSMLLAKQAQKDQTAAQGDQLSTEPTSLSSATSSDSGESSVKGLGRGLGAMKALLARQQTAGLGRGLKFAAQSSPVETPAPSQTPSQIPSQSQHTSKSSSPTTPTQEMAEMRLQEAEPRHPAPTERKRAPTITMKGTSGTKADLCANYVRVKCRNSGVFQYHVHYSPMVDSKNLRIGLLHEHKDLLKTKAFDGSILFLPFKLPDNETVLTSKRRTDDTIITLTLSFVKVVPPEQCSHLYNVLFRRIMHILKMCPVGRYHYNPHTPASIPQHKLEVWPGYITAVKEHEGGLLLLLDASHKVLRTETVYDIMEELIHKNPNGCQDEIMKKIVGNVVLTRYNNKTYRIDDIVWSKKPTSTFSYGSSGEEMSFCDYYKKQYNITIKNVCQPLLLHKEKLPRGALPSQKPRSEFICLIPELCYMCGLTDDIRKEFVVMKDLAAHTRVTPAQRQVAMKKFIQSVNNTAEARAELDMWGLELDTSTVPIVGRLLQPEKITFGQGKVVVSSHQADWSRDVCRSELLSPVNIRNWVVFYTRKDTPRASNFVKTLMTETRNMGISCQPPLRVELENDRIEVLVRRLRDAINPQVQIVVVINPTKREDRYSAIKKVCCVEAPVPSQVINSQTISRPDKLRSIVQKIALQMNCKLGGELWAVKIPLEKLMVVGIDAFHDNVRGKQSIGGFVSSLNETCTRWYSNVCFQKPGQELVYGLQICMTAALHKFHAERHFLPQKIVIFRDGVGDGQLDVLADHEVKQLQRCFTTFGPEYQPDTTTVVVQKRINTRIYEKERDGGVVNPKPGTVVDHTVTKRDRYDYFIVSQHVRQGTVSPTHYIVVDDGMNLGPDKMQKLTYKMTHLYYNWPGTVRVPAPCQYAHKLAYLVGESIHKAPDESLSDRLFFL